MTKKNLMMRFARETAQTSFMQKSVEHLCIIIFCQKCMIEWHPVANHTAECSEHTTKCDYQSFRPSFRFKRLVYAEHHIAKRSPTQPSQLKKEKQQNQCSYPHKNLFTNFKMTHSPMKHPPGLQLQVICDYPMNDYYNELKIICTYILQHIYKYDIIHLIHTPFIFQVRQTRI